MFRRGGVVRVKGSEVGVLSRGEKSWKVKKVKEKREEGIRKRKKKKGEVEVKRVKERGKRG